MKRLKYIKAAILAECVLLALASLLLYGEKKETLPVLSGAVARDDEEEAEKKESHGSEGEKEYIKWVEFHAPAEIMTAAYRFDVETYGEKIHLDWIDLLAYVAAKHGGKFPSGTGKELEETAEKLRAGEVTMEELTDGMEYFSYYRKAYDAILGGFVGEYKIQKRQEDGTVTWENCYGLKAFSPVAKGFYYEDYDDFGVSRSFGYSRPHLGHDMMGQIGTPTRI